MSLLTKLDSIVKNGKITWDNTKAISEFLFDDYTRAPGGDKEFVNRLIQGDNLPVCKYLINNGMGGKLKMIYVDPPFFSKADYKTEIKLHVDGEKKIPVIKQSAYKDSWEHGMEEYLTMLASRLFAFRDLLDDEGCIWVHLDWHAVHYVKVLMDEIFGEDNFVNEVIWNYKSGGAGKRRYSRKHDTLLFYGKTKNYYFKPQQEKSYNRGLKPYRFKGVKEYKDETGWYTLVNMKDVWQIDMVGRTSAERTGYATQKPEALLLRLIESCTKKGDICADFFGGSGTMAAASEKAGRKWISCDIGKLASINMLKRLLEEEASFIQMSADKYMSSADNIDSSVGVDVNIENVPASDMEHITVTLTGYKIPANGEIPVSETDLDQVRKVEKEDWLQLIDYFALDLDYDGRIFAPHIYAFKEKDYIVSSLEKLIKSSGTIAVKIIDIFGNTSVRII